MDGVYTYDDRLDQLVAAMTVFGAEGSALQSGVQAPSEETVEPYLAANV
jgi:hypothetical protein